MLFSVHFGILAVQRSIYKLSLMDKIQSHEHSNRQLQTGGGGLSDPYDDTDSSALYKLAAPDSVIFNIEFESVQNHCISSDVHCKCHCTTKSYGDLGSLYIYYFIVNYVLSERFLIKSILYCS